MTEKRRRDLGKITVEVDAGDSTYQWAPEAGQPDEGFPDTRSANQWAAEQGLDRWRIVRVVGRYRAQVTRTVVEDDEAE